VSRFALTLLTAVLLAAAEGPRRFERRLQEANKGIEAGIRERQRRCR
jgi:hypothetical protein